MNKYDIVNAERERVIDALFRAAGQCCFCRKRACAHGSRELPRTLPTDTVLRAINIGNYFGTDEDTTKEE